MLDVLKDGLSFVKPVHLFSPLSVLHGDQSVAGRYISLIKGVQKQRERKFFALFCPSMFSILFANAWKNIAIIVY